MLIEFPRLCFLTQDREDRSHVEQAELALQAGVRWIQFRTKQIIDQEIIAQAKEIKKLSDRFESLLIINDHVELCSEINADGVHLGDLDLEVDKARIIVGDRRIIGRTCHSAHDIAQAALIRADYVGIGPYATTETKDSQRLKPVLGLTGISRLCRFEKSLPKIAIGGIDLADIHALINAGCYGIAICSAICRASDLSNKAREFVERSISCRN